RTIAGGRCVVVPRADIKRIPDAPQTASGSRGLTLLVADKEAAAQARLIVALNAKWIARADRVRRRGTKYGHSACDQHRWNRSAHSNLRKLPSPFHQFHHGNSSGAFAISSIHSHTSIPPLGKM